MEQAEGSTASGKDSQKQDRAHRVGVMIKRAAAIACFFAAIYLIIGSYFYGDWWFGLFWDGKLFNWRYIANGFFYLFDNHFVGTIIAISGLFVIALALAPLKARVARLLDQFWPWIAAGSLVAILVAALFIYHNFEGSYMADEFPDHFAPNRFATNFRLQMEALTNQITKPKLLAPIDFKYLDQSRTETLYNEILPELIEKERSVETDSKRGIKGTMSGGPIGGEVSSEKSAQVRSNFERPDFSPSRKCIELMNFAIQSGRARVYYTDAIWLADRTNKDIINSVENLRGAPIEDVLKRLQPGPPTSQEVAEAEEKEKRFVAELYNEMSSLEGLIFIAGEFKLDGITGDQQIIAHEFAQKPQPVRFEIKLPSTAHPDQILLGRKAWLHVFASVDRALDRGVVTMHAIAVF